MEAFAGARSTSEAREHAPLRARLRLAEIGLSWPPETFLMLKLRSLAQRGVEVRIGSFPAAMGTAPAPAGVEVAMLPDLRGGWRALSGFARDMIKLDLAGPRVLLRNLRRRLPLRLWRLHLHLVRTRADVVHIEWLTVASRCLPLLAVWDGRLVVSCHGFELTTGEPLSNQAGPAVLPRIFARADAVHVVSEAKLDEALAHGLDPAKATLIRAGVDTALFRPPAYRRAGGAGLSVVSVSWLRWLKGYEYALLAISELVRQGIPVTLDILGGDPPADMDEPSQRARIVHTARDLGLDGHVRLHGNAPPSEVAARLQRADAFLHSSVSEGLPTVVVEAMACGLPVVATDVGGTREALREGIDGFLVAPRDPEAAAAALRTLWLDPDLRARMGDAGRARVESEFTIEGHTERWLDLYARVARGN